MINPKHFCDCGKEVYCNCMPKCDCGKNILCTCNEDDNSKSEV